MARSSSFVTAAPTTSRLPIAISRTLPRRRPITNGWTEPGTTSARCGVFEDWIVAVFDVDSWERFGNVLVVSEGRPT